MPARPLVLCFHSVSTTWEDALAITPADFELHIGSLLRRGYSPATCEDVIGGRGKLLHVTFDDAFAGISGAAAVLAALSVPATIFVCADYADGGGRAIDLPELAAAAPSELVTLDWDALRSLADEGVEIGSHGLSHAHLTQIDDGHLARELQSSKSRIEEMLGRPCRFFAYPFGENDERVRAAVRDAGYTAAFGLPGDRSWGDPFSLPRVGIWRGERRLRVRLKASRLGPALAIAKALTSRTPRETTVSSLGARPA